MISFKRFGSDVYFYVKSDEVDNSYSFKVVCNDTIQAYALVRYLETSLGDKIQSIRKEAYDLGWKEAKSHKAKKETWFSRWW